MDIQLKYSAVLRSTNVDPLQLILGSNLALDELAYFAVDFTHLFRNFTAQVHIDLNDLELDFGDLHFRLRYGGNKLRLFAIEPRRLPLQLRKPSQRHQVLPEQIAHSVELAID